MYTHITHHIFGELKEGKNNFAHFRIVGIDIIFYNIQLDMEFWERADDFDWRNFENIRVMVTPFGFIPFRLKY